MKWLIKFSPPIALLLGVYYGWAAIYLFAQGQSFSLPLFAAIAWFWVGYKMRQINLRQQALNNLISSWFFTYHRGGKDWSNLRMKQFLFLTDWQSLVTLKRPLMPHAPWSVSDEGQVELSWYSQLERQDVAVNRITARLKDAGTSLSFSDLRLDERLDPAYKTVIEKLLQDSSHLSDVAFYQWFKTHFPITSPLKNTKDLKGLAKIYRKEQGKE